MSWLAHHAFGIIIFAVAILIAVIAVLNTKSAPKQAPVTDSEPDPWKPFALADDLADQRRARVLRKATAYREIL